MWDDTEHKNDVENEDANEKVKDTTLEKRTSTTADESYFLNDPP